MSKLTDMIDMENELDCLWEFLHRNDMCHDRDIGYACPICAEGDDE